MLSKGLIGADPDWKYVEGVRRVGRFATRSTACWCELPLLGVQALTCFSRATAHPATCTPLFPQSAAGGDPLPGAIVRPALLCQLLLLMWRLRRLEAGEFADTARSGCTVPLCSAVA